MTSRRHLIWFVGMVLVILAIVVALTSSNNLYRSSPLDFASLRSGEVVYLFGAGRQAAVDLKIGFAEQHEPPDIGAYGNHQMKFFSVDDFGTNLKPRYFFNLWLADVALPGIRDLLIYLASIDRLPKSTILYFMTTPNNDNGGHILGYHGHLPTDVIWSAMIGSGMLDMSRLWEYFRSLASTLEVSLRWSNLYWAILGQSEIGIYDNEKCRDRKSLASVRRSVVDYLPTGFRAAFGWFEDVCDRIRAHRRVFGRDGAYLDDYYPFNSPIKNKVPLHASESLLQPGDEFLIASIIREIHELAIHHDRKAVLVIPPVYETPLRSGMANEIVDRALALVPEAVVVDHRSLGSEESWFRDYDHPGRLYYKFMTEELRRRGLIPN